MNLLLFFLLLDKKFFLKRIFLYLSLISRYIYKQQLYIKYFTIFDLLSIFMGDESLLHLCFDSLWAHRKNAHTNNNTDLHHSHSLKKKLLTNTLPSSNIVCTSKADSLSFFVLIGMRTKIKFSCETKGLAFFSPVQATPCRSQLASCSSSSLIVFFTLVRTCFMMVLNSSSL